MSKVNAARTITAETELLVTPVQKFLEHFVLRVYCTHLLTYLLTVILPLRDQDRLLLDRPILTNFKLITRIKSYVFALLAMFQFLRFRKWHD